MKSKIDCRECTHYSQRTRTCGHIKDNQLIYGEWNKKGNCTKYVKGVNNV